MNIHERYALFQDEAVAAILEDFADQPSGRFMLVVPTGGGKTWTAVRSIYEILQAGTLAAGAEVVWVAHRAELLTQAGDTFDEVATHLGVASIRGAVRFSMLSAIKKTLSAAGGELRLAIIDEAHHGAAPSYQPLFDDARLGVLGLTATPSRHDGLPLRFERESYSIGFPDLIEKGVLIRPEVIRVEAPRVEGITSIGGDADLSALNTEQRNRLVLKTLLGRPSDFQKVIIYAASAENARSLYEMAKASKLGDEYQAVGYILGGERACFDFSTSSEVRNEDRRDFIEAQKAFSRSVLINVDVLTEGYDDPTTNVVVMARPTQSKLVYMQAMGRAVRLDKNNEDKRAFVVEIVDDLPNIRYRIDNRWLFSDISDVLEPQVEDRYYPSLEALPAHIESVFDEMHVPKVRRWLPETTERDRVTMLLFKVYERGGRYSHVPIVITNGTRRQVANFHNFFAQRMAKLKGGSIEAGYNAIRSELEGIPALAGEDRRRIVFNAFENAYDALDDLPDGDPIRAGYPWMTFIAFRLRREEADLDAGLLDFTEEMLNRDRIRDRLRAGEFEDGFVLLKLPLPLSAFWGRVVPPSEAEAMHRLVAALTTHRDLEDALGQWTAVVQVLGATTFPLEQMFRDSPLTIVREQLDYFRTLSK